MATNDEHSTQLRGTTLDDRVPWNQLIAFGMGGLIPIALFNIAGQLMSLLGNISLGLDAILLNTVMAIPRFWEAITDPVVGHLSDNTRTRWGRRRPYILFGGITVALAFMAIWWVPRSESFKAHFPSETAYDVFLLTYILGGMSLFFAACAVFDIPHGALGLEMSNDPHERTRLFSAKSFLGNLFAMGTPWFILLAGMELFSGTGGDPVDGMRYLSILIAAILIPLSIWWFLTLREPGFAVAKKQTQSKFWHDMRATVRNRSFLMLTAIVFTLATGFNFVSNLGNYITIFYMYGGDLIAAGPLLGWNGLLWAITALVAVFPLNWVSRRLGKRNTLLIAILLMCVAQLAKIVCYNPTLPYLLLIPTMLLSAGMLMFFTLGAAMVGDVCDEDELNTGTRTEGTYFAIFWWFIKTGTAVATIIAGVLLQFTSFDQKQNVEATAVSNAITRANSEAEQWQAEERDVDSGISEIDKYISNAVQKLEKLRAHLAERKEENPSQLEHFGSMLEKTNSLLSRATSLQGRRAEWANRPAIVIEETNELMKDSMDLTQQSPRTLFRLRLVEIGLPLALSVVSILLTLRYPLTEQRCYEIKELLKKRREELAAST